MTVRSEGQFNTVVYEEEDIYRAQERRDVILMKIEQVGGIACHTGRRSCFFNKLEKENWQDVEPVLKDPKEISLRDVLAAVEGSSVFALHSTVPNPLCPVGRTIQSLLAGPFRSAQEALEQDLARTTIAALAESAKG